jgi:uncharacterized protein (DUF433 family)
MLWRSSFLLDALYESQRLGFNGHALWWVPTWGGTAHPTFLQGIMKAAISEGDDMTSVTQQSSIIRTERGLTIAGTRITLYDVMDYAIAQYPPKFIRGLFNLTDEQISAALSYIETNRTEVEAEYQTVLRETEELRQYYEERNRDLIARLATKPPQPGMEAAWEKLQAQKAKHQAQHESHA